MSQLLVSILIKKLETLTKKRKHFSLFRTTLQDFLTGCILVNYISLEKLPSVLILSSQLEKWQ